MSTSAIFSMRDFGADKGACFSRRESHLHHRLKFVKVPGLERMSIDANVNRKRARIVGQVTVRVSIEVPRALRMAGPDSHGIVAKHDSLLRYVDLGQHAPTGKEILLRSGDLVVIAFDEMDCLAG